MPKIQASGGRTVHPLVRLAIVLALLYLFLVAIQLLSATFKGLGKETADNLIGAISNPFASLAAGILATVLVQSSSVTTSFIVAAVVWNPETDDLREAIRVYIPMIMGANIGTTITNTLASLGSVTRNTEFRLAFAGATMHDFFNLMCVAIMLPIEIATGFLSRGAVWLVEILSLDQGVEYKSPIKAAVKAGQKLIDGLLHDVLGFSDTPLAVCAIAVALALIFVCLVFITRNMRQLMSNQLETAINRSLEKSGLLGILIGIVVTVSVQSSSITTSILVPMFAAGLLTLDNGFPIMLGANIGTTVTALLAAVVKGPAGLALALVHLLFNLCGTLIFYPFPAMRRIPIRLSEGLARRATHNKLFVVYYIVGVFVVIPLLGILIFD